MGKDGKKSGRERREKGGEKLVNLTIKVYAHGNALISLYSTAY